MLHAAIAQAKAAGTEPRVAILALSGGAEDGAYGAGVLKGWSERGDRPVFSVVTGVSTGALIAPFAFLGQEHDDALERLFTETRTNDILVLEPVKALLGAISLGNNSPLRRQLSRAITPAFLDAVAEAHRNGRRLFIATTNLDSRSPVIWNMGDIALRGDADALALFREVMAASAAIPGAFPPSYIDVRIDGETYQEMHVDGGVTNSVFVAPDWFRPSRKLADALGPYTELYIIQNNKIRPDYGPAEDNLIDIAGDAMSELIRNQSRGDLIRIYALSTRNGLDFHVSTVPSDFEMPKREQFDPLYMRALYEVGAKLGRSGEAWSDHPPGLPAWFDKPGRKRPKRLEKRPKARATRG